MTRPPSNSEEEWNKSRPRRRCDMQLCGSPPESPPPHSLTRSLWVFKCFQLVSCSVQPMTAYTLPIIVTSWCVPKMNSEAKKTCLGGWERKRQRQKIKKKSIFLLTQTSPRQGSLWLRCCFSKTPVTIMFNCFLIVLHALPGRSCRHEKLGNQGDIRARAQAPPLPCGTGVMYMPH